MSRWMKTRLMPARHLALGRSETAGSWRPQAETVGRELECLAGAGQTPTQRRSALMPLVRFVSSERFELPSQSPTGRTGHGRRPSARCIHRVGNSVQCLLLASCLCVASFSLQVGQRHDQRPTSQPCSRADTSFRVAGVSTCSGRGDRPSQCRCRVQTSSVSFVRGVI